MPVNLDINYSDALPTGCAEVVNRFDCVYLVLHCKIPIHLVFQFDFVCSFSCLHVKACDTSTSIDFKYIIYDTLGLIGTNVVFFYRNRGRYHTVNKT